LNESLAVGVVTGTHGLAGELKVKSFSGQMDHLVALHEACFRGRHQERQVALQSVRPQPPGVIVKIAGVDTPEQARRFIGCEMWVPRSLAAPLASGEYYTADLCRCSVWFGAEEIGEVRSIWEGGPMQLLEVRAKGGRTVLVPFTEHFVGAVELEKGRICLTEDEIVR
jgi:16S rRNA processing protein RimM